MPPAVYNGQVEKVERNQKSWQKKARSCLPRVWIK